MNRWAWLPCLIVLHGPDGAPLQIETSSIYAIRPATPSIQEHLAKGTNTVIYLGSKVFGVTETPQEIVDLKERCEP